MGANSRLAGTGYGVDIGEGEDKKTYTLAPLSPVIKGRFEDWMHRRAAFNVERSRKLAEETPPAITPERLAVIEGEHAHLTLHDGYTWGAKGWQSFINAGPGRHHLTFLCLQKNHQDATEKLAVQLWDEAPEAMQLALEWLLTRPNSKGRAPTPGQESSTAGDPSSSPAGAGSACSTAAA